MDQRIDPPEPDALNELKAVSQKLDHLLAKADIIIGHLGKIAMNTSPGPTAGMRSSYRR